MLRALGSLFFYTRFYSSFSAVGYRRRSAGWAPFRPDYSGQRWLVTGASGGIGSAIALGAVRGGARVWALARDPHKLAALRASGGSNIEAHTVDLSSVRAVRRSAAALADLGEPIDVLVLNVGVLLDQHALTDEGFERSFATNLLNHYVLAETLKARGALRPEGCVISMSSGGMYGTGLKLDAMNALSADAHDGMAAYAMHKRAQVELTRHWNQQWSGQPRAYVMHPGWADTEGVQSALPWFRAVLKRQLRNAEQAADTALWLASVRPAIAAEGGIWLDRERQPEHAFAFTRQSTPDAAQLASFLATQAARVAEAA